MPRSARIHRQGRHRRFAAALSSATSAALLSIGYRLLPHFSITTALEDGLAGYRRLLDDGFRPEKIVFAGDSVDGGLTFLS